MESRDLQHDIVGGNENKISGGRWGKMKLFYNVTFFQN